MTKAVAAAEAASVAEPKAPFISMSRFLIPIAIGAAIGSALGYFGQCSSGTCPLTSTWWRGAIYGSVMGLLMALGSGR